MGGGGLIWVWVFLLSTLQVPFNGWFAGEEGVPIYPLQEPRVREPWYPLPFTLKGGHNHQVRTWHVLPLDFFWCMRVGNGMIVFVISCRSIAAIASRILDLPFSFFSVL